MWNADSCLSSCTIFVDFHFLLMHRASLIMIRAFSKEAVRVFLSAVLSVTCVKFNVVGYEFSYPSLKEVSPCVCEKVCVKVHRILTRCLEKFSGVLLSWWRNICLLLSDRFNVIRRVCLDLLLSHEWRILS